ncbi:MAG: hypothetical protein K0R31_1070 [Clostridiales bacterium]|nr:hypothetical protein [Clostridiales bacterium]
MKSQAANKSYNTILQQFNIKEHCKLSSFIVNTLSNFEELKNCYKNNKESIEAAFSIL